MQKLISGHIRGGVIAVAVALAAGFSACKKEAPSLAHYDRDSVDQTFGGARLRKKKVLLIGIDGAPGKLVQSINPSVIASLLPHSVYTWSGVNDTVSTVAAGWAGLTTGMPYLKHQIGDSTLIPKSVEGGHSDIKYYESFIHYLKADDSKTKVTAITQWEDLNNFLLNQADKVINVSRTDGDKGVANAAIAQLANGSEQVVIANFSSPAKAGLQAGFSDNPVYRQAITDVDSYIGKMMDALKARKDTANEDWLVVIQSTSGGYAQQMGGKSEMERSTFTVFYSPLIVPGKVDGPRMMDYGVRYHGGDPGYVRAENNDGGLYNPGSGNMTIEAQVKFNKGPNGNYQFTFPPFLTKCVRLDGTIPGWSFYRSYDKVVFVMQDGANATETEMSQGINDGNFHSIAATITHTNDATNGHVYTANVYMDGIPAGTGKILHGAPTLESPSPLIIGYNPEVWYPDNVVDMYMANVRIWNAALPADVVKKYAFITDIDAAHPNYKNLIGNWRSNDKSGNKLKDSSPSKKDFTIVGNYSWDFVGAALDKTDPAPSIFDVVPSIMDWIGITLQGNDKPAGKSWLRIVGNK
ncbi:DUF4983 domain-containing protein [Chitinophaga vietnamensis]|uniref:DUF4983 domain-containing protein n=1 Tax=Chitinophaga vietnamensis TaxID=2593957 RepID=UPI0011780CAF|nr:LamG-like jellyroll fold domain-containing protein [Chitinophaga vietnamensis]